MLSQTNLINDLVFSELCNLVYLDDLDFIKSKLKNYAIQFVDFIDIEETCTQALVCSYYDRLYIVVRGTSSFKDVKRDFNAVMSKYQGARVHTGFLVGALSVLPRLLKHCYGVREFFVTGHSLGGSIAAIIASMLLEHKFNNVNLVTFGCPRVGDSKFNKILEGLSSLHNYVNNNDVVTKIPFSLFYRRLRNRFYINRKGYIFFEPFQHYIFFDRLIGRFLYRLLNPVKIRTDGLNDHLIKNYIITIKMSIK